MKRTAFTSSISLLQILLHSGSLQLKMTIFHHHISSALLSNVCLNTQRILNQENYVKDSPEQMNAAIDPDCNQSGVNMSFKKCFQNTNTHTQKPLDGDVSATYKGTGFHFSLPFECSYPSSAAKLCSSLVK